MTEEGARLLDPSGRLKAGAPVAPAEGDAGTGMVATNSVGQRTANVSAGTSIFAMVVLEGALKALHEEIDLVTTPAGDLVAMAHCNNGTIDLSAWVSLFGEVASAVGAEVDTTRLFEALYGAALTGDPDGGGMLAYNYLAGEHVTGLEAGRPLFVRTPSSRFTLANFMRTHLFASLGALRVGMDVLLKDEGVQLDSMFAHGGLFKTKGVAQRFLAAAMNTPVSVGEVAGEGGAWVWHCWPTSCVLVGATSRRGSRRRCSPALTSTPSTPTPPTSPASTSSWSATAPASPSSARPSTPSPEAPERGANSRKSNSVRFFPDFKEKSNTVRFSGIVRKAG